MITLWAGLVAFIVFVLIIATAKYQRRRESLNMLKKMKRYGIKPIAETKRLDSPLKEKILGIIQKMAKPLAEVDFAQSLETKLHRAGLNLLGSEYIIISMLVSLAGGIIVFVLTLSLLSALLIGLLISLIMWLVVLMRIQRRLNLFIEQLGDCLLTISNALRAGYSFQQAVEVISNDMKPPISEEFARITHDIAMGMSLEDALENANKRVGSPDFQLVITAVLIQHEVGGNLAQILDNISYTIVERLRMKREINSLTAQGRLSAIVLLLLPFGAGAAMYVVNHDDFVQMLNDPMGQMAMMISFALEIVGFFIIRKIVDIEV